MEPDPKEVEQLIRDKYHGDRSVDITEDLARLRAGEPLDYVIGWKPFLGLKICLDSKPLIPRPETEWWTELMVADLAERFGDSPFTFLDMCAGSGAIGLAVLKACPQAQVTFSELVPAHAELIRINLMLAENRLDVSRAEVRVGDLFDPVEERRFDIVAANPPYIPEGRELDASVADHEPHEALYAGTDGLTLIRKIAAEAPRHIHAGGSLWMECDTDNVHEAAYLLREEGAIRTDVRTDLYGRDRVVLAWYP